MTGLAPSARKFPAGLMGLLAQEKDLPAEVLSEEARPILGLG